MLNAHMHHARGSYPEMAKLMVIALVLPYATAECERGFSAHNRIVTSARESLTLPTVQNLVTISLSDDGDFDVDTVLEKWLDDTPVQPSSPSLHPPTSVSFCPIHYHKPTHTL